jgi:ADP-dependent NAD(P)H-hydrate dehydratase / NAD(P)H-hydrate epimerase
VISLYTPEQVRAMDARAFERGVPPLDLMERAAGHLARGILDLAGYGYGLRVAVLAGKGNNGGDGIAAARILADAGAAATVCLVGGADDLSDDAAAQLERWRGTGGPVGTDVAATLRRADVAVDCLLGTGASGVLRTPYDEAAQALADAGLPVVACDLPSGVDADTGAAPGPAVRADLTVTLGAHKRGLWLWPARGHCGQIVLGDLGIVDDGDEPAAEVLDEPDVAALVPPPGRTVDKRSRGVVLAVAGSPGMTGAATLVARGAMSAGAGLVTVATRAGGRAMVAPTIPEALTVELPADPDEAMATLGTHLDTVDAVAVGPGLGRDDDAVALVRRLVREVDVPLILDADGLNAFRHDGDTLADHASPLLVLTPHERELARMLDDDVWTDRASAVPDRAKAWNAVLVAKGPGTLVAAPDGRVWVNPTGGPGLATGGTGDVLTGMLAALLAGDGRADVVPAGVWLHGLAGELAGGGTAARSVTAIDVAAAVTDALVELDL